MKNLSRCVLSALAALGLCLSAACDRGRREEVPPPGSSVKSEYEVKTPEGKVEVERKTTTERDGDVKTEVEVERKTDRE